MTRWTYYSPFFVGILIVLVLNQPIKAASIGAWNLTHDWQWYSVLATIALAAGTLGQGGMLAFQGAFAQVLPVPSGRSIRGDAASRAGWLLLGAIVLGATACVLWFQGLSMAWMIVAGVALGAFITAALTYVWNIPAAIVDFPAGD